MIHTIDTKELDDLIQSLVDCRSEAESYVSNSL